MKRLLWSAALLAALALLVTGCPGGGDPVSGNKGSKAKFWLSATEGGKAASGNQLTLTEDCNVYVYFKAPGATFNRIRVTYNVNPGQNLSYAALYDMFDDDIHTWGITNWETDWFGGDDNVVVEIDPADYGSKWSSSGDSTHAQHNRAGIDRAKIFGVCINFDDINDGDRIAFKLINVEFVGLQTGPNKTLLNAAITVAEDFDEADYTPASWADFASALVIAKNLADSSSATQTQINNALSALNAAIAALEPLVVADKIALNSLISTADALVQANYTPASWSAFQIVLAAAKTASASNWAQAQIDSAEEALQDAIDALVELMYFTEFYIGAAKTGSIVQLSDNASLISGSIVVPYDNVKGESRLQLTISPAIDITAYGKMTIDWTGHGNASYNISLYFGSSRRMLQKTASNSTTLDFVTDLPDWTDGWADAAIGSLTGIEIFCDTSSYNGTYTISKITIDGAPPAPLRLNNNLQAD